MKPGRPPLGEAWGAEVDGRLAASLLAFTCGDYCSVLYQQSGTPFLAQGVNNVLTFVFTNKYLQKQYTNLSLRLDQIKNGEFDSRLDELMKLPIDKLKIIYEKQQADKRMI